MSPLFNIYLQYNCSYNAWNLLNDKRQASIYFSFGKILMAKRRRFE